VVDKYKKSLVIIAGATGGVGRAAVDVLSGSTSVDIIGISRGEFEPPSSNYQHLIMNLTDPLASNELQKKILCEGYDAVHWLHCVGSFKEYASFSNTKTEDILDVFNGNVLPTIHALKFWLNCAVDLRAGNFVMYSAFSIPHSYPFMTSFNSGKAASEVLMTSLTNEVLLEDVTLNCLRVSTIDTPLERELKKDGDIENWLNTKEAASAGLEVLLNRQKPRMRGGIIPIYKPSYSFHGESVANRFGKNSSNFSN